MAHAARGQHRVQGRVGQAGARDRAAGGQHQVAGQAQLAASHKGRILTEDLGQRAQAILVAPEDRHALFASGNNLRGFLFAIHKRGRGSLCRSAIVELDGLGVAAARRAAAEVGGALPALLTIHVGLLVVQLLVHVYRALLGVVVFTVADVITAVLALRVLILLGDVLVAVLALLVGALRGVGVLVILSLVGGLVLAALSLTLVVLSLVALGVAVALGTSLTLVGALGVVEVSVGILSVVGFLLHELVAGRLVGVCAALVFQLSLGGFLNLILQIGTGLVGLLLGGVLSLILAVVLGLPGSGGLLVHRVVEHVAQVRGDLRGGARRRRLRLGRIGGGLTLGGLSRGLDRDGTRGDRGGGGGGTEELRGVAIQARSDRVHVEEEAAVRHLAQVHQVHLDAGGRQNRQGGTHRRIDFASDHDQAGARANSRRHRVAELRPACAETLGARRVLSRQIRPGQRRHDCQTRQ